MKAVPLSHPNPIIPQGLFRAVVAVMVTQLTKRCSENVVVTKIIVTETLQNNVIITLIYVLRSFFTF